MLDRFGPLFVLGLAVALLGWAAVVLTSRIKRQRQEAHRERFAVPERGMRHGSDRPAVIES
jgi:hypothetical protein